VVTGGAESLNSGEILETKARFQAWFGAAVGVRDVVLDVAAMRAWDGAALGGVIGLSKVVQSRGGELVLVRPQPGIRSLIELTRLGSVIPAFDAVEAGFEYLARRERAAPASGQAASAHAVGRTPEPVTETDTTGSVGRARASEAAKEFPGLNSGVEADFRLACGVQAGVAILTPSGPLASSVCGVFRERLDSFLEGQPEVKDLVMEMRHVGAVDESGFGLLILTYKRSQKRGGRVALVGVNSLLAQLLCLMRCDRLFLVCCSVADALRMLAGVKGGGRANAG
jgi:anti-anti-sigma factor